MTSCKQVHVRSAKITRAIGPSVVTSVVTTSDCRATVTSVRFPSSIIVTRRAAQTMQPDCLSTFSRINARTIQRRISSPIVDAFNPAPIPGEIRWSAAVRESTAGGRSGGRLGAYRIDRLTDVVSAVARPRQTPHCPAVVTENTDSATPRSGL